MESIKAVKTWLGFVLIIAGFLFLFSEGESFFMSSLNRPFPIQSAKATSGDSIQWKQPGYNDSHWQEELPTPPSNYWLRLSFTLDSTSQNVHPLGIGIRSFLGSYEAYWDGHLIGRSGKIGNTALEEVPGGIDRLFMLPIPLSQEGDHTISLRVTQHHAVNHQTFPFVTISSYDSLSQTLIIIAAFMHIVAGIFIVVSIYYFLIFWKSIRQSAFLFFGCLGLFLFFWLILEYVKFYYSYPYPFHYIRLELINVLVTLTMLTLTAYISKRFAPLLFKYLIAIQFVIQMMIIYLVSDFDLVTYYKINLGVCMNLFISIWAYLRKKPFAVESILSLTPLAISSLYFKPFLYDQTLFIAFLFFILVNLYVLSKIVGNINRRLENTRQQANLLKIQLLKRNIQPHYLMNTLTSLISWVEESPKVAVQFIEALAEEFKQLRLVAEKKLIPLTEEISLCRSHLEVMKFRNEINYQLHSTNIKSDQMIPPALFLTLLENGLTHNQIISDQATFQLDSKKEAANVVFTFFAPGIIKDNQDEISYGTGLKYVEACLMENYGEKWELKSMAIENGWLTIIKLYE